MQFGWIDSFASQDLQISWGLLAKSSGGPCVMAWSCLGLRCFQRFAGNCSGFETDAPRLEEPGSAGERISTFDKELNFKSYPHTVR